MQNINIIDNWDDITLKKFMQLKKCYKIEDKNERFYKILETLSDKDAEYFKNLDANYMEILLNNIKFLKDDITKESFNSIEIDGEEYHINFENKLKLMEFIDSETVMNSDSNAFDIILAILCRKKDEPYDDDYIANKFEKRQEMFANQSITKIYPLINFFLNKWEQSSKTTQLYLIAIKKLAMKFLENIEASAKSGTGKRHFSKSQMKTLQNLKKQVSNI